MYRYQRFGTVMLPTGNVNQKVGSMATADSTVTVGGGSTFDALGSDDAPSKPGTVTLTASLRESSRTALETSFRELQALRGKILKLYRAWEPSGRVEWIYARLMQVDASANFWSNRRMGAVQMKWALLDNVWNGDDHAVWTLDSGEYFDTGLDFDNVGVEITVTPIECSLISCTHIFSIENKGNAKVNALRLIIDSGYPLEITGAMTIKSPYPYERIHIELDESIVNRIHPFNERIVIDNENLTASLRDSSGVDTNAYSEFNLGVTHQTEEWISLLPGENNFLLTYTKTSTATSRITIIAEFSDGWQ